MIVSNFLRKDSSCPRYLFSVAIHRVAFFLLYLVLTVVR